MKTRNSKQSPMSWILTRLLVLGVAAAALWMGPVSHDSAAGAPEAPGTLWTEATGSEDPDFG